MNPVKIFVEGRFDKEKRIAHSSDSRFLKECIQHWFKVELDLAENFVHIGGVSELIDMAATIRQAQVLNHEVLVVVDANGDFAKQKTFVEGFQQGNGLSFPFFLFPDNSITGQVETLLEKVAIQRKFIDCYNDYEKCIGKGLGLKAKVFAYIAAASANPQDANEATRKFDSELFDFNHPAFNPLKEFLTPFFR